MPREGAAILSQVEGLLEQFLELEYDTPVKDAVSQMLEQVVRPGMEELRTESDAQVQSEGRVPDDQGTAGEEGEVASAADEPEPTPPPQHAEMRDAREQASQDMRERKGSFAGEGPKSRGEKRQQVAEDRRRKKAKA